MSTLKIGADPEFLVVNRSTRMPVPAHRFFPDKDHKILGPGGKYEDGSGHGYHKLFRDGYMLEINIPGSHCRELLLADLRKGLEAARAMVGDAHDIVPASATRIDLTEMLTAPDDCKQFGCDPSLDAYTGVAKIPPIDALTHDWRYGGGHMHFSVRTDGWPKKQAPSMEEIQKKGENGEELDEYVIAHKENHPQVIKMMDLYVGVPLSLIFNQPETFLRRRYYGQAGEYRSQFYNKTTLGVEYRTPGPEMWFHQGIYSLAFGVARWVLLNYFKLLKGWDKSKEAATRHAVNTGEGLWKLVQEVPGYYNVDTLKALAKMDFKQPGAVSTHYYGWREFVIDNKLPVPEAVVKMFAEPRPWQYYADSDPVGSVRRKQYQRALAAYKESQNGYRYIAGLAER